MKSMTGFGRGEALSADGRILFRTEVSSVNRKQFEVKMFLPKEMLSAEIEIRRLVAARISRGSLSLRVETVFREDGGSQLTVNRPQLLSLLTQLRSAAAEAGLSAEPRPELLLQIPGIIEQRSVDFSDPQLLEALKQSCSAALDALIRMRETEGANLKLEFERRLALLSDTVDKIEPLAAAVPKIQQEKLIRRLQENGLAAGIDDERVLREVVVFTDRSDVTEEITRLRSHFSHFREFLDDTEQAMGRSMDFLTQEIFREINTLGNKAPTTEISPMIVLLKTEVEKIREQVQNIE
ncbi:MAG: YicC family protein [Lentisphaeria bacterium]|nr:YicC family protein [Lentisphaeria bacterium]